MGIWCGNIIACRSWFCCHGMTVANTTKKSCNSSSSGVILDYSPTGRCAQSDSSPVNVHQKMVVCDIYGHPSRFRGNPDINQWVLFKPQGKNRMKRIAKIKQPTEMMTTEGGQGGFLGHWYLGGLVQ